MQNLDYIENEDLCASEAQDTVVDKPKSKVSLFAKARAGATAIEYALIASLIAVAIIGTLQTLGTDVSDTFQDVSDGITGAAAATP